MAIENINFTEIDSSALTETKYWKDFLAHRDCFEHSALETCTGCSFLDVCTPCPFEFGSENRQVSECEWVWDNLQKDMDNNLEKRLQVNPGVSYKNERIIKEGTAVLETNATGIQIIKIINEFNGSISLKKLINIMSDIYDAPEYIIGRDIMFAINGMLSRGIIHLL